MYIERDKRKKKEMKMKAIVELCCIFLHFLEIFLEYYANY